MILLRDKNFSKDEKKVSLKDVKSNRGFVRTAIISKASFGGAYFGRKAGKKAADKADEEGARDIEIIDRAKKAGRNVGALSGGAIAAVTGAVMAPKGKAWKTISKGVQQEVTKRTAKNMAQGAGVTGTVGAILGGIGGRDISLDGYRQVGYEKEPLKVIGGKIKHGRQKFIFEKNGKKYSWETDDHQFGTTCLKLKLEGRQKFEDYFRKTVLSNLKEEKE